MEIIISYSPTILKHAMVQRLETTFLKVQGSWTLPCIVSGSFFTIWRFLSENDHNEQKDRTLLDQYMCYSLKVLRYGQ